MKSPSAHEPPSMQKKLWTGGSASGHKYLRSYMRTRNRLKEEIEQKVSEAKEHKAHEGDNGGWV
jgi:hypothetical protein